MGVASAVRCPPSREVLDTWGAAAAHIQIVAPRQRHVDQKAGPCGLLNGMRTANVCEFRPGATITVEWGETVEHPGHFRVSFDEDGVDGLLDPTDYDDFYTAPSVLLDDIPDHDTSSDGNRRYSVQVPLPDVECDNCTLQLIQVMTDKMPWGPEGGNDIYYQCADIVLSSAAPAEPAPGCGPTATGGPDAGPGGGGGGNDAGGGADAGNGGGDGGGDQGSGQGGGGAAGGSSDGSGGCAIAAPTPAGFAGALIIALGALALFRPTQSPGRRRAKSACGAPTGDRRRRVSA